MQKGYRAVYVPVVGFDERAVKFSIVPVGDSRESEIDKVACATVEGTEDIGIERGYSTVD